MAERAQAIIRARDTWTARLDDVRRAAGEPETWLRGPGCRRRLGVFPFHVTVTSPITSRAEESTACASCAICGPRRRARPRCSPADRPRRDRRGRRVRGLAGPVLVDRSHRRSSSSSRAPSSSRSPARCSSAWSPPRSPPTGPPTSAAGCAGSRCCQPMPALDATPVGELLDRIDGDVYQVGSELRGSGIRLAQSVGVRRPVRRRRDRRLVARGRGDDRARRRALRSRLRRRIAADRPRPDVRGGGLVRPRRRHGGGASTARTTSAPPSPSPTSCASSPGGAARCSPAAASSGGCRRHVTTIASGRVRGSRSPVVVAGGAWALATGPGRRRPADLGLAARRRVRRHRRARHADAPRAAEHARGLGPDPAARRRRRRSRSAACRRSRATSRSGA